MPDAVRLEMPDWLLPLLAERFDAAELAALLQPAPLDLRVNLLKTTREEARAALAAEGLEATPTPLSPWGLRIEGRRQVTTGPAFRSGLVEIQDEGSQLVAALTGARPGMRVADLCAGAGGKTLALAMMMQNRGQLLACDVSAARLDGAVRRLRRAGVHNVERHLIEPGDKWAKRRAGSFDRVLVDAPCTGTGTWRRNPDARLRLTEADLAELLPKQAAILDQAATAGSQRRPFGLRYLLPALRGERGPGDRIPRPPPRLRPGPAGARLAGRCAAEPGRFPVPHAGPPRHRRVLRRGAGAAHMISIRRARPSDAIAIGAVHVAAWRSTYPGILPDGFLARLSVPRQAAHYDAAIRSSTAVFVAAASGTDVPPGSGSRIVGFTTAGRARGGEIAGRRLAEGEVETLYVLDDWRDRGVGRKLMRAAAAHLAETGCRSCFVWVLRDNPSRWFYQRLGGKPVAEAMIQFAGQKVPQTAFVWDPIERLLAASPQAS